MDVVGEGDEDLVVALVVLHGDLGDRVAPGAGEIDHILVDGRLVLVEEAHILADAALIAHLLGPLLPLALILDGDGQAAVEEGLLAHAVVQDLIVVDRLVEHLGVGLEAHGGTVFLRLADHVDRLEDVAAAEAHLIDLPVLVDLDLQPLGEGVDHGGAHAVQAAGDLVASAAELAAGVQHREDDLQRALAGLLLDIHGNAAAVVGDADDVPRLDNDLDMRAVAGQRLVDGVVHDLIHQMVQSRGRGGADIHARPLAHRLQALEDLDLRGVVFLCDFFGDICHSFLQIVILRSVETKNLTA